MKFSLGKLLTPLWLLFVAVCGALVLLMMGLFQLGIDAQVAHVQAEVDRSADLIVQRLGTYLSSYSSLPASFDDEPRKRELNLLLGLVLAEHRGVEGGFWTKTGGFVAYGFPTYQGGLPKTDVPEAEKGRLLKVLAAAADSKKSQRQKFETDSECLVLSARPAGPGGLTLWTMARAHVESAVAYRKLTTGFIILLTFITLSGAALLWFVHQWSRKVQNLVHAIEVSRGDELPVLPETGQLELDQLVTALSGLNDRLTESRHHANGLATQLARAERMAALGRMAAGVAHEVRNPVAAIRLKAENALAKTSDHHQAALEFVLREVHRLDDLLERLLAMTRLHELKPETVNISEWLQSRADAQSDQASAKQIDLQTQSSVKQCQFDLKAMTRAVDNLLLNALQHTPPGGWIRLSVTPSQNGVQVSVEDTGQGVPKEDRDKIFEPFVTGRPDGSGLGLNIVRQIVEAHRGHVRCAAGQIGARFEIELPCERS